ncbi:aminopeptidase [Pleomorphovibrio marinus]|uniref:aminopeptidase n=1 Tax=Pleomorphovibrio marinus TaxID=2164132 RepID=UPI000E0B082F|nr:aminopeptidase [Pleomorphovibrio marinus]
MPTPELLTQILHLRSVSGDESRIASQISEYVFKRKYKWKVTPEIFFGDFFQNNIILRFGNPKTALFAHMDTVGFTARYENQLVPIGGPEVQDGDWIEGQDEIGEIKCQVFVKDGNLFHNFPRAIQVGTLLSYAQQVHDNGDSLQAAYLDNRIGVYAALKICEELENGLVVFSTYEEHGGGSIPLLSKFIYEKWQISQALIADITWVTDGVHPGKGVVISLRDSYIPRKSYLDRILKLAQCSGVPFQLEVEAHGGSDGRELQLCPYPIDWCFVGAPEENTHSPREKVNWNDINAMVDLHLYLMRHL